MPGISHPEDIMGFLRRNPGFVGLKLHPTIDEVKLNDERVIKFLSRLNGMTHPSGRKYTVLFDSNAKYAEPQQLKELCEKFTNINFIFGHIFIQKNWDKRMEAIEVARKHDNVFLETSWVQTDVIMEAIKRAGAGKVLFGSDVQGPEHYFMPWDGSSYGGIIKYLHEHLTREEFALVMSGNAKRLFGFDQAMQAPDTGGSANTVVIDGSDKAQTVHMVYEPQPEYILSSTPGGIDLDPTMLNLRTKRDGKGVSFPVAADGAIEVNGFTPVIIRITPMHSPLLPDTG